MSVREEMDIKIQDIDLLTKLQKMYMIRQKIDEQECRFAPDFKEQFKKVYGVMSVREEMERCEYLCSEASLSMLPLHHKILAHSPTSAAHSQGSVHPSWRPTHPQFLQWQRRPSNSHNDPDS